MNIWYALVDLLPFEWAESGSMFFMKNALLAILVISPLFGLMSTMVVQSRMSFFSDALGHSAFAGIAIGTLCGLAAPTWCAVALAVVFALLFSLVRSSFTKFNSLLVGDILSVSPARIGLLAVILLAVVVLWVAALNQLTLSAVHPALAGSRGVSLFAVEAVFNCAVAVVVTLTMTWIGLLVINSLLILPGAMARNIAKNMRQYTLFSLLGALLAGIAGLMLSYYIGSSAGASITLVLAVFFAVTFCFRKKRL